MRTKFTQSFKIQAVEKEKWNEYFKEATDGKGQEHEGSLWWQISDDDTLAIIKSLFHPEQEISMLEAGCGSAGSSYFIAASLPVSEIRLSDVSEHALAFAKQIQPEGLSAQVEFALESAFELQVPDNSFDLVWNVGVIEHYVENELIDMVKEMLRVTRVGGYTVVAIPNRNSIAVLKAWLLGTAFGRKFLKALPGYCFDTEALYGNKQLLCLFKDTFGIDAELFFAGNLLWVGAPTFMVEMVNRVLPQSRFSFLSFFVLKKVK